MKEISVYIPGFVQNSIHARASLVTIRVTEDIRLNILHYGITDFGKGMNAIAFIRKMITEKLNEIVT